MKERREDEISLRRTSRQRAGRPKKGTEPQGPPIPRLARLMALALKFEGMIDRGEVKDYADIARLGFVTRARMTQIMNLLNLAPDIQEEILLTAPNMVERHTRRIAAEAEWRLQRNVWSTIQPRTGKLSPGQ